MASNVRSLTPEFDTSAAALKARHEKRMAELRRHATPPDELAQMQAAALREAQRRYDERLAARSRHDQEQRQLRLVRRDAVVEFGDACRASADKLIAYAALTEQVYEGGYYTNIRLRASFARHADGFTLTRALKQLCALYPQLGEVLLALFPQDDDARPKTQDEIAGVLHVDQSTVSRKLRRALTYLGALYEGLADDAALIDITADEDDMAV